MDATDIAVQSGGDKRQVTVDCSNVQLHASLKSGNKGNLYAVRTIWPHSAGWEYDEAMALSTQPAAIQVATEESETPVDLDLRAEI